jgi:diacylglycerol kinase family enzyme
MFHIAPMAKNFDGAFDLLIAAPVSRSRVVTLLPKIMSGAHLRENEIVHKPVTQVVVECSEPVDSHLDGEVQPLQDRFEVSLFAGALRLL